MGLVDMDGLGMGSGRGKGLATRGSEQGSDRWPRSRLGKRDRTRHRQHDFEARNEVGEGDLEGGKGEAKSARGAGRS